MSKNLSSSYIFTCSGCGCTGIGLDEDELLVPEDPTIQLCGSCKRAMLEDEDTHALFCLKCRRISHSVKLSGVTDEAGNPVDVRTMIGPIAFIRECGRCTENFDPSLVRLITRSKLFEEQHGRQHRTHGG